MVHVKGNPLRDHKDRKKSFPLYSQADTTRYIHALKKQEKSQITKLTLHLKELEKEEQTNPKLVEGKKS